VNVVGHDDEAVEVVAGLVEVVESVGNDGGTAWVFEETLTVGLVEEVFEGKGETPVELGIGL
jgi:hypothetical protein